MNLTKKYKNLHLIISIVFFLAALSQKVYCSDGDCGYLGGGLAALISGIFGVLAGGACLTWFANPIILVSWITSQKPKISIIFSLLALIIGISFSFFDEIIINEAGHYGEITGYRAGYYLWVLSFMSMVVGNILRLKNKKAAKLE